MTYILKLEVKNNHGYHKTTKQFTYPKRLLRNIFLDSFNDFKKSFPSKPFPNKIGSPRRISCFFGLQDS